MSGVIPLLLLYVVMIGTTAIFEPRPSLEASASFPYSFPHSPSFSPPSFLASSITPSSHLSLGLLLCLLPSTTATKTLLAGLCSSSRITCLSRLRRLIVIYVTMKVVVMWTGLD